MTNKKTATAQNALDEVKQLGQEVDQMGIEDLEATITIVAEIGHWAWIIQTQALMRLMALREKLPGGRGHQAALGAGYEQFLDEWAEKIRKSKSWIRTNMQILKTFGTYRFDRLPGFENRPRNTYLGSKVTVDDDEMFRRVEVDAGHQTDYLEFIPHPELRRAHYEAALPAPDPKSIIAQVVDEVDGGETITATEIRRRVRDARLEAQGFIRIHVDVPIELRRRLNIIAARARLSERDALARAITLLEADLESQEMPVAA